MANRCEWVGTDPLMIEYHDREWGVPVHDDRVLFEFLILEGAQAGLNWNTILKKRENYRAALDGFDVEKIARYTDSDVGRLMGNAGIVRNRLKVASTISNANAFLRVQNEFGSFNDYVWAFTDGKPVINRWKSTGQIPSSTATSDSISRDLKKRGFRFVGSTICYAFMQAVGMVNDHTVNCWRHSQVRNIANVRGAAS